MTTEFKQLDRAVPFKSTFPNGCLIIAANSCTVFPNMILEISFSDVRPTAASSQRHNLGEDSSGRCRLIQEKMR